MGRTGLIPAHAGKTAWSFVLVLSDGAHPRSRGENLRLYGLGAMNEGSSPLTRGKRIRAACPPTATGLIPAHAGKTSPSRATTKHNWAHPRSRGENPEGVQDVLANWGSSPLTRGKQAGAPVVRLANGLIPAHAGKTPRDGAV